MKRMVCAALAAALLVPGSWALRARANEEGEGMHPGMHHEMGEKMAERMKEKLGLTAEQEAKLKDVRKAHLEAMKPLGRKMKDGVKKLEDQLKAKASDAELQATLDSLKAARKEMSAEQERFHESLASFLTPAQQAKMVVWMGHKMHERMEHRGGPRRGPRMGGKDDGDEKEDDGE